MERSLTEILSGVDFQAFFIYLGMDLKLIKIKA